MKNWIETRRGKFIGHFLCEDLMLKDGTLYALRNGKIIGAVASGPGLFWVVSPSIQN
jgi:hypothetical protein